MSSQPKRDAGPVRGRAGGIAVTAISILAGLVALALTYRLLADAPADPGDYLLRAIDAQGNSPYRLPGSLFGPLAHAIDVPFWTDTKLRVTALAVTALGVSAIACTLPRVKGFCLSGALVTCGVLGLWPWLHDAPAAVVLASHAFVPLFVALAVLAARVTPQWPFAAAIAGLASAGFAETLSGFGEVVLVFALLLGAGALRAAVLGALSYSAGYAGAGLLLSPLTNAIPRSGTFWTDVGLTPDVPGSVAAQAALALIGALWLLLRSGRQARLAGAIGLAAVAVGLFVTGLGVHRLQRQARVLNRDLPALENALRTINLRYVKALFLNLPLHARPYLRTFFVHAESLANHSLLETWVTRSQMHVLPEWASYWRGTPVVQWTARGFVRKEWGACIDLDPFPLAVRLDASAPELPASQADLSTLPALPAALGGAGATTAAGTKVESEVSNEGIRVWIEAPGRTAVAVAAGSGRRTRLDADDFFTRGLSVAWHARIPETQLALPADGRKLRRLPGYGVAVEVPPGRTELAVLQ